MAFPLHPYSKSHGQTLSFGATSGWGGTGSWVSYFKTSAGSRQAKPYNIDTHYVMDEYSTVFGPADCRSWSWSPLTTVDYAKANNIARKHFIGQLGDMSSFGATATAEGQKTLSMVVTVVTRLTSAAKHVKRLEFFQAASLLGLPYREVVKTKYRYRTEYVSKRNGLGRRRVRTRVRYSETRMNWGDGTDHAKTLASGWLMWSYGASPLITDVQNAMQVFTRELPTKVIEARGSSVWEERHESDGTTTLRKSESRVKFKCKVRVKNPNLWLANQLGLTNPLQWINEAIPLSFIVDWFSNLSDVISQISDFDGIEVLTPKRMSKGTINEFYYPTDGYQLSWQKKWVTFKRDFTIPPVTLTFAYERFQLQRGLNAISLLIGILPRK